MRLLALLWLAAQLALTGVSTGCHGGTPALVRTVDAGVEEVDPAEPLLAALERDESSARASTDWAAFPASDATLGPDPYDIVALSDGRFAGVLRGASAVVLLDRDGRELARASAPRAARSLALLTDAAGGKLVMAGELDAALMTTRVDAHGFADSAAWAVPGAVGVRGVAVGGGAIHAVDVDGRLLSFAGATPAHEREVGPFALTPRAVGGWLAAMSVLGHRVLLWRLDAAVRPVELTSDGPPLGFAVRAVGDDVLVAVGMIEDHPLDRTGGSFGHIDSFLRVVRVRTTGEVTRLLELNLSQYGVVTPKALAFLDEDTVLVAGAGSGRAARVVLSTSAVTEVPSLPGVVALVPTAEGFIGASPLLDAWIVVDNSGARAVPVPPVSAANVRSIDSKLGEALVFTTIMAPRQRSEGALSRFTCEACHFEGTIDGRIHDTGRMSVVTLSAGHSAAAHVRATTKPLWGLFNNKPLFTRAMDPNLARMAHAEFRVANANSSLDPWFALTPADAPWLSLLGVTGTRSPIDVRRALVAFLHDFTPRANPRVVNRAAPRTFTPLEQRGAELFRARCVSCHAARLIGDDPASAQPIERWQALVLADNGPLVWSSAEHKKTGIEPYVHEDGARASSLRRVWLKSPLFTNGSARTLEDALDRARQDDTTFMHSSNRESARGLADEDKRALMAFLRLL